MLGRLEDFADGEGRVIGEPADQLIAVRRGDSIHIWKNMCPHAGLPMNLPDGRVLVHKSGQIICPVHGASFDMVTGACTGGPAAGEALVAVESDVSAGKIRLR